jgi:50S ribosomal subunit-associated GTPase HflX
MKIDKEIRNRRKQGTKRRKRRKRRKKRLKREKLVGYTRSWGV